MTTSVASPAKANRMAHWVLRVTELQKTLRFFKEVFGMVTIRHEENHEGCKITCNGRFNRPWSKTMVGYPGHTEDEYYCLELTYNYGVKRYDNDNGLRTIAVAVPDVSAAVAAAEKLGYRVEEADAEVVVDCAANKDDGDGTTAGNQYPLVRQQTAKVIVGPDQYRYLPLPADSPSGGGPSSTKREEPFVSVCLNVNDVAASERFWRETLDMRTVTLDGNVAVLTYDQPHSTFLVLRGTNVNLNSKEEGAEAATSSTNPIVTPSAFSGRVAISCPDVSGYYKKFSEGDVVHELQVLEEALGQLEIAIVKDPSGFEICLVTSAVFDPSTKAAANWQEPDWEFRNQKGTGEN